MRVAIAGAGAVGRSIARELIHNGHQVLLIDKEPASIRPERVPDAEWLLADSCELSSLEEAHLDNCDVVIPDPSVSRQHVALHYDGTRCLLEDLSGQGTLVAGQPMQHGELPDGADLNLGPWSAIFRSISRLPVHKGGLRRLVEHSDRRRRIAERQASVCTGRSFHGDASTGCC